MTKKMFFIMFISLCIFSCSKVYAYEVYEHENNDSYEKAQPVYSGYEVIGKINERDDSDYYKFKAEDNGKLTVTLKHTYDDTDWRIYVYMYVNGKYEEVQYTKVNSTDSEVYTLPFVGVVKGNTYYINVESGYYADKYNLLFDFQKNEYIEREFNDYYDEATDVHVGTYEGIINWSVNLSGDCDYYRFMAPNNGILKIKFLHKYADCDWTITYFMYYDGKYEEMHEKRIEYVDSEMIELPYIGVVKNSRYYIKIRNHYSSGDSYKLVVDFEPSEYIEKEFNDSFVTANPIENNQKYYGIIGKEAYSYLNDVDYYIYNAVVDGAIKMEFEHDYSSGEIILDVFVYDEYTYKPIDSYEVELDSRTKVERYYYDIKKGKNYYFKIKGDYYCGSEKYSFKVFNKRIGKYSSQVIKAMDDEKNIDEIKFGKLKFNTDGVKNNEIGLKWKKVPSAKWYVIYGNECGKGKKYKYIKSVSKLKCKVKKIDGIKIKKAKNYKFTCLAIDEFGSVITAAKTVHVSTTGGKLGNIKEINLTNINNKKLNMKTGGTYTVKYKLNKPKKKIIADHRGVRFESSNSKIAKVDAKKGKITAVKKGSCKIFVYTQNGCYRVISLKVE
ncbi:MAG TPA: hypothetical protein DCW44_01810 [Eubacterium sp.]|nr:hypothetical protein [Eubacterium sp.]